MFQKDLQISIIIPNYNGNTLLSKNIPRVIEALRAYQERIEFIITDDASTDNSLEVIHDLIRHFPMVAIHLVTSKKNTGFSGNVNRGVAQAKGDILYLLNSDVYADHDFLAPLLAHFSDPHVFAVGSMDKSIEGKHTVLRGRGIGSWNKGFLMHRLGSIEKTNTLWVSCGSGSFRRDIWEKLGGLDEVYNPFYWEDIDLSYRALKSGYTLAFEPKSIVVHEHDRGSIKSHNSSSHIQKYAYRNQFIFVWKNITDSTLIMDHIVWLLYHCIASIKGKEWNFFYGLSTALLRLPRILKSRHIARQQFIRKDKDILQQFLS